MLPSTSLRIIAFSIHCAGALKIAVLSKVIVDNIADKLRPGGGGVQAAAGARLGADDAKAEIAFHAPVGRDFDMNMLTSLATNYSVNLSGVVMLDSIDTTPGEVISYASDGATMEYRPVGWEQWDELCDWEPEGPLDDLDALHVIVEGGGKGEVRAALRAVSEAKRGLPCVGVEPILHDVTAPNLARLRQLTRVATVVSPDLATAFCIRDVAVADEASGGRGGTNCSCKPSTIDAEVLSTVREPLVATAESDGTKAAAATAADCILLEVAAACYDELAMQPGALLALRDGAHGSYLYTRPFPGAKMQQWMACTPGNRVFEWLARVPAKRLPDDELLDPTGAGNAYAGALTAQLATGAEMIGAAAVASATGAAFCGSDDWAPCDVAEARSWVQAASEDLRCCTRVAEVPR